MNINARALGCWSAAAVTTGLLSTNPFHRLALLLVAANVAVALRRSGAAIRPVVIGLALASVLAVIINILTSHSGTHTLITLPSIPGLGGAVTLEALVYGVVIALGIAAAVIAAAPLALALEPEQLVDALPHRLERTGAAVGGALSIIPRLVRTTSDIRDSNRVRGWTVVKREPLRAVLVPALLTAVEDSVQLAEAMEARGFGGARRTRWTAQAWNAGDIAVVVGAVAAVTVGAIARLTGGITDWYPFPSVSMPAAEPASVVAALLLLVPVVVWRR